MFNLNQALVAIAAIITCVHLLFAISSAVMSINNLSIEYAQSISAPPTGRSAANITSVTPIMLALRRFVVANAST